MILYFMLMLFFVIIALSFNASADINYIENGWIKTVDDDNVDSLLTTYTTNSYDIESKTVSFNKLSGFDNYASDITNSYDTSKIPVRYYRKVWNNDTEDYDLVHESKFDSYIKGTTDNFSFVPKEFECNSDYVMKVGFGTVTYDGVSDSIIILDGSSSTPITMTDVYDADLSGGWNQVFKHNDTMFSVECTLIIGNDVNITHFIVDTENVYFYDPSTAYDRIIYLKDKSNMYIVDSYIYFKHNTGTDNALIDMKNGDSDIYVYINNSMIDGSAQNNRIRNYNGNLLINNSIIQRMSFYELNGYNSMENSIFYDTYYGFFSNYFDVFDNNVVVCVYSFMYPAYGVTGFVNFTNTVFRDNGDTKPSILINQNVNSGLDLRLIDCTSKHSSSLFNTFWSGTTTLHNWNRSNTFNLLTEPDSNVVLYDKDDNIIFNLTSDSDGFIDEQIVDVITHNETTEYIYHTPFRLMISKDGYVTYNQTFNNSFKKMDYIVFLESDSRTVMQEVILGNSLFIFILWAFIVVMMYKTNRNYVFMSLILGLVQIVLIGSAFMLGFYTDIIEYWLVAGFGFLCLSIYKTYKGLR